jgi:hypothetical protein
VARPEGIHEDHRAIFRAFDNLDFANGNDERPIARIPFFKDDLAVAKQPRPHSLIELREGRVIDVVKRAPQPEKRAERQPMR